MLIQCAIVLTRPSAFANTEFANMLVRNSVRLFQIWSI